MHNMKKQALISCSDKSGVVEFAKALTELGYHILSTGGTAKLIAQAGIPVQEVADYTGFPEMLDGRVKTLNPKIHAGILARRPVAEHMEALKQFEIDPIDIVAVNLYPFEQAIANPNCTFCCEESRKRHRYSFSRRLHKSHRRDQRKGQRFS